MQKVSNLHSLWALIDIYCHFIWMILQIKWEYLSHCAVRHMVGTRFFSSRPVWTGFHNLTHSLNIVWCPGWPWKAKPVVLKLKLLIPTNSVARWNIKMLTELLLSKDARLTARCPLDHTSMATAPTPNTPHHLLMHRCNDENHKIFLPPPLYVF